MPLVTIDDLLTAPDADAMKTRARELSKIYDQYTVAPGDGHARRPGIHASECSGCQRKVVYSLLAYERRDQKSKNWRQRFEVGHALHHMIQRDCHAIARRSGGLIDFEDEVKIAPELQPLAAKWFINSSCDGVFTFRDTPGGVPTLRVGLEIKTEAPDGYDKLRAPKPEHVEQAHIYMAVLDIPLFWFFYMNKGNQNNTGSDGPFLIEFNPHIWAELENRFQAAHDYAERYELPERQEGTVCQFCAFAYTCQPPSLILGRSTSTRVWQPR